MKKKKSIVKKNNIIFLVLILVAVVWLGAGFLIGLGGIDTTGKSEKLDDKGKALKYLTDYTGFKDAELEYVSDNGKIFEFIVVDSKDTDEEMYYSIDVVTKKITTDVVSPAPENGNVIDDESEMEPNPNEVDIELAPGETLDDTIPRDVREENKSNDTVE